MEENNKVEWDIDTNRPIVRGLHDKWGLDKDTLGFWIIGSCTGDQIACDIPMKELAEHIVELHNKDIDRRWEFETAPGPTMPE